MQLQNPSKAGTYESNDIYIMLFPNSDGNKVELESVVYETYGKQIENIIFSVLKKYHIENVLVKAIDKGALDFTIRARLLTALKRGGINV